MGALDRVAGCILDLLAAVAVLPASPPLSLCHTHTPTHKNIQTPISAHEKVVWVCIGGCALPWHGGAPLYAPIWL